MPRLVNKNPTYRKHRSGQAFVVLDGRHVYLGPHGTKASRDEYDRFIGEWLANGRRLKPEAGSTVKVADLILAYRQSVLTSQASPFDRTGLIRAHAPQSGGHSMPCASTWLTRSSR